MSVVPALIRPMHSLYEAHFVPPRVTPLIWLAYSMPSVFATAAASAITTTASYDSAA